MTGSLRTRLVAGLALVVLTFSMGASATQAKPPAHDVVVVNPPTSPVPVDVVNTGARPVLTRSVDHHALEPFQAKVRIDLADGACCDNAFVSVPPDRRLVIEYASATGMADPGQKFMFEVGTKLNGNTTFDENHFLPVLHDASVGRTHDVAGQVVRIYADPGHSVMLRASRHALGTTGAPGAATVFMTISGHLVPAP